MHKNLIISIPVAARSKAWVCGRSVAAIADSNPAGGTDVCCECFVLSGRGLCVWLITRPEKSAECGLSECDSEASTVWRPWPTRGLCHKNFE